MSTSNARRRSCSFLIDPHVHVRDWAQSDKETLAHGLMVARRSGITALFDMPNTNPPLTSREAVTRRLREANALASGVSYHIWAGVTGDTQQVKEVAKQIGRASCRERV